jgi:predicted phage terminase large subunit-like protein
MPEVPPHGSPLTDTLGFVPGDAEWQRLRKKGLSSLYFFAYEICKYGTRVPMTEPAHKLLCKIVERKTGVEALDKAWVRKFEMPRGTGKTTVITQAYLLQRICRNPDISIMLVNENEGTAKAILSEIKTQIESNELLRVLFPEIVPDDFKDTTWSATQITTKRTQGRKEPTIFVVGVGGTKTGMHPDVIFVDDMLSREAMESARAGSVADVMGQINRWIHQLNPLLSGAPDREITFIGTRWWHGDSYEHLEENYGYGRDPQHFLLKATLSDGTKQALPAYRVGDIVVFRRAAIEDGQPAFESLNKDKYGLEGLAKERMRDPELFAANMMNQPADALTRVFKEHWLRYYDIEDDQVSYIDQNGRRKNIPLGSLDILVFVDPGGFKKAKGGDRARGAIVVTGSREGLHFILDAHSEKQNYTAVQKELVALVQRYGARKVFIENAGQQIAFIDGCRTQLRAAGFSVPVEEAPPGTKDKDDRILALEDFFERAMVYVGHGAKFGEFLSQYEKFPKTTRKDLLDALSMAPTRWQKVGGGPRTAEQRQRQELAAYYARRGLVA